MPRIQAWEGAVSCLTSLEACLFPVECLYQSKEKWEPGSPHLREYLTVKSYEAIIQELIQNYSIQTHKRIWSCTRHTDHPVKWATQTSVMLPIKMRERSHFKEGRKQKFFGWDFYLKWIFVVLAVLSLFLWEISSSLPWRISFFVPLQNTWSEMAPVVNLVGLGVAILHNLRTIFLFP